MLDGILHGPQRGWYMNGQLEYEYARKKGVIHGKYLRWYEDGKLLREGVFQNGKMIEGCNWDEEGNLIYKRIQKDKDLFTELEYYKNGKISTRVEMYKSKRHGVTVSYKENGEIDPTKCQAYVRGKSMDFKPEHIKLMKEYLECFNFKICNPHETISSPTPQPN